MRAFGCALLALTLAGCVDPPASDLLPVYDPTGLFTDAPRRATVDPGAGIETVTRRPVALPGGFSSSLPESWDGWIHAVGDHVAITVHEGAGGVDVWIYAERPSGRLASAPSLEWDRFLRTVAPGLSSPTLRAAPQPTRSVARKLSAASGLQRTALRGALACLETRTLGRGLGFTPALETFSGYRWLAVGARGARLHLARVDGWWGTQPPRLPGVEALLDELNRQRADGSRPLEDVVAAWPTVTTRSDRFTRLVVGRIVHRGLPLHLAILCRSPCPQADPLELFIDQLAADGTSPRDGKTTPYALAYRHGIEVQALDPAAVWRAVRKVSDEPIGARGADGPRPSPRPPTR
ncbi:MAG: hypothetical protein AAGC60_03700 [Acidobacteriota bacterium]